MQNLVRYRSQQSEYNQQAWDIPGGAVDITVGKTGVCLEWLGSSQPSTRSSTIRPSLETTQDRWLNQVQAGDPTSPKYSPRPSRANSRLAQHEITRKVTKSGVMKKSIFKSIQSNDIHDNASNSIPNLPAKPIPYVNKHSSLPNLKPSKGSGKGNGTIRDAESIPPQRESQYQWIQQSLNGDIDSPTYALLPAKLPPSHPHPKKEIPPPDPVHVPTRSSQTKSLPLHARLSSSKKRLTEERPPSVSNLPHQHKEIPPIPALSADAASLPLQKKPFNSMKGLTEEQIPSVSNPQHEDKGITPPDQARDQALSVAASLLLAPSSFNGKEGPSEGQIPSVSNHHQRDTGISPPDQARDQSLSSEIITSLYQAGPGNSKEQLTENRAPSEFSPPQPDKGISPPVPARDPTQSETATLPSQASPNNSKKRMATRQLPLVSNLQQDKKVSIPVSARDPTLSLETASLPHQASPSDRKEIEEKIPSASNPEQEEREISHPVPVRDQAPSSEAETPSHSAGRGNNKERLAENQAPSIFNPLQEHKEVSPSAPAHNPARSGTATLPYPACPSNSKKRLATKQLPLVSNLWQDKKDTPPIPARDPALSSEAAPPPRQASPPNSKNGLTGEQIPPVSSLQQNKEIPSAVPAHEPARSEIATLPHQASHTSSRKRLAKRQIPFVSLPPHVKEISAPAAPRGPARSPETATIPHRASTDSSKKRQTEKQRRPLRLLAFDGGGVRGISSLYILKTIMGRIGDNIKPCEFFDLIAGTSTGGLIAIMLGRLRMSIEECITKYNSLAEEIFTRPLLGRTISILTSGAAFSEEKFESVIKALVEERVGDDEAPLFDGVKRRCPVFVLASPAENLNNLPARRFRSYALPHHNLDADHCPIWQAARATSAAPTYFHPCTVYGAGYVDGGLLCNNPAEEILSEYRYLYGEERRLGCMLSIGTGMQPNLRSAAEWYNLRDTFVGISVDGESTHRRVKERFATPDSGRYFRFNAGKKTKDGKDWAPLIELDEYWKMDELVELTKHYLQENEQMVEDCAKALSSIADTKYLEHREARRLCRPASKM